MTITLFRTLILYILIIFSVRLMGKRQIGELQPSELVITILISNIASLPVENSEIPLIAGVVPILALVCFEVLVSAITLKSPAARRMIGGTPRTVIRHGVIDQKELRELRFSVDDLMEELRFAGIFDIRDVECAVVETNGNMSTYLKSYARPTTPADLKIETKNEAPPALVINDGKLVPEGIRQSCKDTRWIQNFLQKEGIRPEEIFFMTIDAKGIPYIVRKERPIHADGHAANG